MFDFDRESTRHIPEPDLVPILDGLVSVIFFLLLSMSFIGLTKLTVPPSSSSTTSIDNKRPLSPKVKVSHTKTNLKVELEWLGDKPDQLSVEQLRDPNRAINKELIEKVTRIVAEFKTQFPEEKTMQLTMSEDLNYQEMIAVMDGIRPHFEDIVLNSYKELEQ